MPTCTDAADKVLVIQYQYSPACTLHDVLAGIEVSHGRAPHSRKRRNGAIFPTTARVCVDTALHPRLVYIGQGPPVSHRIVRQDPRASDAGSRVGYHAGFYVFLASISGNLSSLTIQGARRLKPVSPRKGPRALDAVVDKMVCLQALNIRGDVASERMLRRRSEMFLRNHGSGVPVVRLSFEAVPKISRCKNVEWAGWEVVEVR